MKYFLDCKQLCDSSDSITMIKGTNNQVVVNSLLNMADVYVLPSIAEGLPLVLLEAMSAGLPWVSTPVGGSTSSIRSTFKGGKGTERFFRCLILVKPCGSTNASYSREEWKNNFEVSRAGKQYSELLNLEEDLSETIRLSLSSHKISFAKPSLQ
jgi:glycosyltransferase involved in cell wall biosynthesis